MNPKTEEKSSSPPVLTRRKRPPVDEATRNLRNMRRAESGAQPLAKEIRNAILRAKTAWDRGDYGDASENFPRRTVSVIGGMAPCSYLDGTIKNGYEVRRVKTTWCNLIAVWGDRGIVCVPIDFVLPGSCPGVPDPGCPPVCANCDSVTWSNHLCPACHAPLTFWPIK